MEISHLKEFLVIAEIGSFAAAAEQLSVSRSSLSKHIRGVESELGASLFDRTTRRVALNEAGRLLLPYARQIVKLESEYAHAFESNFISAEDSLSIASIPVMAQYGIASILAIFRRTHPSVRMTVDECEGADILPLLEHKEYEMAFMRGDVLDAGIYDRIHLYEDRLAAILPKGHPLASSRAIPLSALGDETFLLLSKATLLYSTCIAACEKSGFTPTVGYTGTRMENIVELVAKGMGVSLMMEKAVAYIDADGVCCVPLEEEIVSTISLVRARKNKPTKAGMFFWEFVKSRNLLANR